MKWEIFARGTFIVAILMLSIPGKSNAQVAAPDAGIPTAGVQGAVPCESKLGERQHCNADTSAGVALVISNGTAACLLGKTWGYDDTGIWVSDGCRGEFIAGKAVQVSPQAKKKPLEHIPNVGFLLY